MYLVFTYGVVYVPCIYLWWSLCTLYLPLVEFIYLVYTSGGVYVPCIYLWWSLCTLYLLACQVSYRRRLRFLLLCLCDVFER